MGLPVSTEMPGDLLSAPSLLPERSPEHHLPEPVCVKVTPTHQGRLAICRSGSEQAPPPGDAAPGISRICAWGDCVELEYRPQTAGPGPPLQAWHFAFSPSSRGMSGCRTRRLGKQQKLPLKCGNVLLGGYSSGGRYWTLLRQQQPRRESRPATPKWPQCPRTCGVSMGRCESPLRGVPTPAHFHRPRAWVPLARMRESRHVARGARDAVGALPRPRAHQRVPIQRTRTRWVFTAQT